MSSSSTFTLTKPRKERTIMELGFITLAQRKSSLDLKPHIKLNDLGLPFIDVVLSERFLLPAQSLTRFGVAPPQTISELCEVSGMPFQEVSQILNDCLAFNMEIWLEGSLDDYLHQESVWVCDMRPQVDYSSEPLHPAARMFHLGNPTAQLALMRNLSKVIVLRETPAYAWSAAMALRGMGVASFVLKPSKSG